MIKKAEQRKFRRGNGSLFRVYNVSCIWINNITFFDVCVSAQACVHVCACVQVFARVCARARVRVFVHGCVYLCRCVCAVYVCAPARVFSCARV